MEKTPEQAEKELLQVYKSRFESMQQRRDKIREILGLAVEYNRMLPKTSDDIAEEGWIPNNCMETFAKISSELQPFLRSIKLAPQIDPLNVFSDIIRIHHENT